MRFGFHDSGLMMTREDVAVFIRIHIAKIVVLRYDDDDDTDMTVDEVVVASVTQSFLFSLNRLLACLLARSLAHSLFQCKAKKVVKQMMIYIHK